MRGSQSPEKAHSLRRLVKKFKPVLLGIQETKREGIDLRIAKQFWGNKPLKWAHIPSRGQSGGLALLWDSDRLEVSEVLKGSFSISISCNLVGSSIKLVCTNVYAPNGVSNKKEFWEELKNIRNTWSAPWLIFGDFNAVRATNERSSGLSSRNERRDFNNFLDDYKMVEFDKEGPKFSYCNQQTPLLSAKLTDLWRMQTGLRYFLVIKKGRSATINQTTVFYYFKALFSAMVVLVRSDFNLTGFWKSN